MSVSMLLLITVLYGFTALSLVWEGKLGMGAMFLCYALANIALIAAIRGY